MQTYRYVTRNSKNGKIDIPVSNELFDKDVEIIILKNDNNGNSKSSARDFINKWSGFLKNTNADNSKYEYLKEKYK
ncbi:MAG: hypothetical protein RO257_09935 [Candidatus Kapabacteria bacterium]|nr:hypothetical protein [Candidatus Kapabacteria bacterium]